MSTQIERGPQTTDNNANQTHYYVTLVIAIVIGLAGTFLRFVYDSFALSMVSNLLLLIGWIIVFRVVFKIMK